MSRPTRFEIMRRNRPKVVKARTTIVEKIDAIEREVTAEWNVDQSQELREIAEACARDRERQLKIQHRYTVGAWIGLIFRRMAGL